MLSFTLPNETSSTRSEIVARVEQDDAERFLVQRAHLGSEQLVDLLRCFDFPPRKDFPRETLAETEGRRQLRALGGSDALDFRQFLHRAATQRV